MKRLLLIFVLITITGTFCFLPVVNSRITNETTEINKEELSFGKMLELTYEVAITDEKYTTIDYPKEINFYGLEFINADADFSYSYTEDGLQETRIQMKFKFKATGEYTGEIILNPIKLEFKDSKDKKTISLQTEEKRLLIIEKEDNTLLLIIIISGAVIILGLSTFIVIILIKKRRKQKLEDEQQKAKEKENLGEIIYVEYLKEKEKKFQKDKKIILTLASKLIKEYIIKKLEVKNLDEFYQNDKYDDILKEEVKRFLYACSTKKYEKDDLSDADVEKIENNFKTLLFVI